MMIRKTFSYVTDINKAKHINDEKANNNKIDTIYRAYDIGENVQMFISIDLYS